MLRTIASLVLFLYCCPYPRHLNSFPTRRSSDLPHEHVVLRGIEQCQAGRLHEFVPLVVPEPPDVAAPLQMVEQDRKSTRLNSSHVRISYAVFCLKKKKKTIHI